MTKSLKNSTHLSAALLCSENGLRVIPMHCTKNDHCTCDVKDCKQPGRHPRIDVATSKPAMIKQHWTKWPKAGIGIPTGAPDIIAVTATGNDGDLALKKLGTLQKTVECRVGKSRIYLFKAPIDAIPDGTMRIAKRVTVRGRGKYVVLPSDLKGTEGRHFVSGRCIGETTIAPAPAWLLTSIGSRLKTSDAKDRETSWDGVTFNTRAVDVDWIADGGQPCDTKKVKRLAESYTATGPRTPPVVRLLDKTKRSGKNVPTYAVLSDRHQIEALKSLGAKTIDCIVADTDDNDACLWQGAELFHRGEATVLDRAEVVLNCLLRLRSKAGQTPTPGRRRQPHDKGYSAAEKLLGVSRRDLRRLEKIAGMCAKAKKDARRRELDNILEALLAVAEEPAERQVKKVRQLAEDYAGGRRKPSAPTKNKKTRVPVDDESDKPEPHEDPPGDAADDVEGDADESDAKTQSPPIVPEGDGLGLPPILRRADGEKQYEAFKARWAQYCGTEFAALPAVMQSKFASDLLGKAVTAIGKGQGGR
jgi:ParB-like chromosome segregation protein Spo0J